MKRLGWKKSTFSSEISIIWFLGRRGHQPLRANHIRFGHETRLLFTTIAMQLFEAMI